ncbi:NAD(P)/FAD-dependent oxidoreductase [Siminovitchia fortis]|uniref:FAD-dependent oxidoreductase n=1 Tax=Siminovitchia fortis TaxID=254758 RepID=A0A451GCA0_9BACI|nr:NAD(P)/FAD-dependent oxidoreductase [Siminovitchia fortis]RWR12860.1 FAD-dependent oxidoreductase [Siminovitchia fortis]WHY80484.1 NAD(P)/FAD-dependent oxidoreductase [Siminovitchia fortis]
MQKQNQTTDFDVIIVGGGFAGLTAARELNMLGRKVLLLEGKDRLGGRTWTDHRLGCDLEMGGTYVHWYHPHTWAEISRYGLEISEAPGAKEAYWITDGQAYSGTPAELNSIVKESFEYFLTKAYEYLPQPFNPLQSSSFTEMDGKSVYDFLNDFSFTNEQKDFLSSLLAIDFNGDPKEGAITQMFRWWAFSGGNRYVFADTVARYKIKTGTKSLVEAIASDVKAEIKMSAIVDSVESGNGSVRVTTRDGESYRATAAIVTAPLSTLDKIDFQPPLSKTKRAFMQEKQVAKGIKVWARIKGKVEPFVSYAPEGYPLNSVHLDNYVDGDSIIVGFGSDAGRLDANDPKAVEAALRHWRTDLEVIDSTGHDWAADELAQETWPMLKPNQLTNYIEEMKRPEQGVFLAGTTYANGWGGFIDGAIENAIKTSRKVHEYLGDCK